MHAKSAKLVMGLSGSEVVGIEPEDVSKLIQPNRSF